MQQASDLQPYRFTSLNDPIVKPVATAKTPMLPPTRSRMASPSSIDEIALPRAGRHQVAADHDRAQIIMANTLSTLAWSEDELRGLLAKGEAWATGAETRMREAEDAVTLTARRASANQRLGKIGLVLSNDQEARVSHAAYLDQIVATKAICDTWDAVNHAIGSADPTFCTRPHLRCPA